MPGVGFWHLKVAGLVIGGAALCCVQAAAENLEFALAQAYNNNPQLLAQRALLRATDEQVPQALSFWRPTVNFTGQVGMATSSLESPGRAVGTNSLRVHEITRPDALVFQASQPIFRGGRTEADHVLGDLLRRGAAAGTSCPLLRLAYTAIKAYEARAAREGARATDTHVR